MTDCANCDGYAADLSAALNRAVRLRARLAAVEAERDALADEVGNLTMADAAVEWRKAEARAEVAEARLAEVEAERDRYKAYNDEFVAARDPASQVAHDLRARLAEVEARLIEASVLTVDFSWRDELLAVIRGDCTHDMYLGFDGPDARCEHGVRVRGEGDQAAEHTCGEAARNGAVGHCLACGGEGES